MHTSTATVAVLPEAENIDIWTLDSEIRVDVFRSSGAGGQNVRKNATAVRITHIQTGLTVACQDERSLQQNRERALGVLCARLLDIKIRAQKAEQDDRRREQIGVAERAEKIRTYNFPQSRITDHRTGDEIYTLEAFFRGDMEAFLDQVSDRLCGEILALAG